MVTHENARRVERSNYTWRPAFVFMSPELPLDYTAIERILPHRYPFLLVDRVTEFEPDRRIVGIKNVSQSERYLWQGPEERPVLPPTILTEAVAQVGAILILSKPENREKLIVFMGIERVRYRRPVSSRRRRRDRGGGQAPAEPDGVAERRRARQRPGRLRRDDDVCAGAEEQRSGRVGIVEAEPGNLQEASALQVNHPPCRRPPVRRLDGLAEDLRDLQDRPGARQRPANATRTTLAIFALRDAHFAHCASGWRYR